MERRPGVADPFLQVSSYGSHIGHEANRVLKNVLVDSLEHIFGSRVGFDPQGEIDVSVAKDLAFNRRALKLKRKDSIFHKNLQKLAGGQTAPAGNIQVIPWYARRKWQVLPLHTFPAL